MSIREYPIGVRVAIVAAVAAAIAVVAFAASGGGAAAEVGARVPKSAPQVFVVGANGQHLRQVTFGRIAHRVLSWMPTGASVADIAYTDPTERGWIESHRTSGPGHRRLSATVSNNFPLSLAFSAASRLTAFEVCCHNRQSLEVVGPPGSTPRVLDSWSDRYNVGTMTAAWSPDGRLIAYIPVTGPPPSVDQEPLWRIAVIAPDGQGRRLLTPARVSNNFTPMFSPHGRSILYCVQPNRAALYTVPTAGGPAHRITQGGFCVDYLAAWSPNGQHVAYITAADGGRHYYLEVVDVRTGRVRRLAGPLRIAGVVQNWGALAWSPDGTKIAFAESDAVETINADGTGLRDLVQIRGSVTIGLAWSPNSRQIAFTVTGHPCSCY